MIPTTREEFAQYCLRSLGAPVIDINVSEQQVDDRIDQALYFYQEYHMEGSDKYYYRYQMTQPDIDNAYITLPEGIIGATKIYPIGDALNTNSLFNMRYQFVINDLYNISNVSIIPYYMVMQHVQFLEQMLVGQQFIRYNRHKNIVYLDMDMQLITAGEWLLVETFQALDPGSFPDIWKDKWLQEYTTALIKRQWGNNTKKLTLELPGGVKWNGQEIYKEADDDVKDLERQMIKGYSLPPSMVIY